MTTGTSGLQPTAMIATQTIEAILTDTKATTGTSGAPISAMPTCTMKETTSAPITITGGSGRLPIVTTTENRATEYVSSTSHHTLTDVSASSL